MLHRRDLLGWTAAGLAGSVLSSEPCWSAPTGKKKKVAAVATIYTPRSHADVILGKILEGWKQDGGPGPNLELASMYIDQFPEGDLSRKMGEKYGVPIFPTIEQAVTVGGESIPVEGVISIGEHGDYPYNDKEQHLYPRRRFFEEITNTFKKYDKVVPVFNDKHLGPVWDDALWMYQRAQELKVPFLAGSSMPVGYRTEENQVPMGSPIEAAVGIGYDGLDIYGFHALEFYQWHVERRIGAEQGVRSVQFLDYSTMWKAVDAGAVPVDLLEAAYQTVHQAGQSKMREDEEASLFLFEYQDGFRGALFMFQAIQGTSVALRLKGKAKSKILTNSFDERTEPRHPHFAYLLKAIESMVHTGKPPYPVERTLLTSGILDRALTSRVEKQRVLKTSELGISYQPVDYPFAPKPEL